ncbi:hypothetical protein PIB30_059199 [Stylosanthes scabra]|uniref:Uncharacterized protein n=1 Tax=Stylosanthes scabra TaxID=79078 RepID=A0ABU6XJ65_9FABA|nr:hypothetical protein [Stylosanthes scabra]
MVILLSPESLDKLLSRLTGVGFFIFCPLAPSMLLKLGLIVSLFSSNLYPNCSALRFFCFAVLWKVPKLDPKLHVCEILILNLHLRSPSSPLGWFQIALNAAPIAPMLKVWSAIILPSKLLEQSSKPDRISSSSKVTTSSSSASLVSLEGSNAVLDVAVSPYYPS